MERILLVTNIFPPHIGGPASFIDWLGHALSQKGYRVTVICSSDSPVEPSDSKRPFRVRRITGRTGIEYNLKISAALMYEMLRSDCVLVNGLERQVWRVSQRIRKHYVLKVVGDTVWETARNSGWTTMGIEEFQVASLQSPQLKRISDERKQYLKQAAAIITPSRYLQRKVLKWGVDPARIKVVTNGVPLDRYSQFQPVRRSEPFLHVGFSGRLTNWKGVETLLLAVQEVDGIDVSIIGDGPELPLLYELTKQLGLIDRINFHGRVNQDKMRQLLAKIHVLVLPSMYEGLSHTLLEASAMGIACVASESGGNPELIEHGITGLLVPYGNVEALKTALVRLRDSEDERYRLACAAKENSKKFDFGHTVKETIDVLSKAKF